MSFIDIWMANNILLYLMLFMSLSVRESCEKFRKSNDYQKGFTADALQSPRHARYQPGLFRLSGALPR
ncbi:hypothetical protein EVY06_06690 [Citrobacter koseri]|uniref:Uncharacterized protein n=2 Tax=Citrobacter koseri TaxID=545 RepID=A8ANJ1_CITK8|nr:hypothetical protein CKO_03982 [Citrobacter koseri ATCC BAA-895]AVE69903.1 hypothetical protein AM351_19860 [Citrobacter koseri]QCQ70431.1 hypothetical protein FD428_05210 [Citrobacter sp. TBCP-5362]AVK73968.1 hypothetical protein CEP66_24565 [Citrobacter koseri]AYY74397.1 hypothetical protein EGX86_11245 [Citrobacter koseri]